MSNYYRLATDLGTFVMWRNNSGHVGIRTEPEHGRYPHNAPAGGWDDVADRVTFGATRYTVNDHLTIGADGTVTHYDNGLSREIMSGRYMDPPAPTHVAKLRKVTEAAVLAWLDTDEGREAGRLADLESATRDRDRLQRDLAELDAKRADMEAELFAAQARMEAARK